MFEKEAEEWFEQSEFKGTCSMCVESFRSSAIAIWERGAEYGYSKANEWHYPSKGELPDKECDCLCYYGSEYALSVSRFFPKYPNVFVPVAWRYLPEPPKEEN